MSCDLLTFNIAQEAEGTPNVFVRKDRLNIIDSQNGNYAANQSVIETSLVITLILLFKTILPACGREHHPIVDSTPGIPLLSSLF